MIPRSGNGGKNYILFRNAINRLAAVTYRNDHFYDPVRGEHRDVGFGFLSYSLPLDPQSSRAWRFAWDPIFFEFCQATGGALRFDFKTYRSLDPACRRLYLLLKKIFWRNETSPEFDLRDLAVNIIGFSPTQETCKLKQKVVRCIDTLQNGEGRPFARWLYGIESPLHEACEGPLPYPLSPWTALRSGPLLLLSA